MATAVDRPRRRGAGIIGGAAQHLALLTARGRPSSPPGRGLIALPAAATALAAGTITAEHVDGLLRAVEATSVEAVASSNLLTVAERRPADLMNRDVREWARRHQTQASLEQRQVRLPPGDARSSTTTTA
ncbi:MAG: hypothetical protein R2695_19710 [Acidimicrobiales bacterium]